MKKPKFYIDAQIAAAVAEQLRRHGVEVVRCEEVGMKFATDDAHLTYAAENGFIMVSCDQDFETMHFTEWLPDGKDHFGIVYCRQPDLCNISTIVENLLYIYESATDEYVLFNKFWRVTK